MFGKIITRGRSSGLKSICKCLSTGSLPPPFPSLSLLFFPPNREPVHRLSLSLSLGDLFHTVGHTKKAVIPTLGLFIQRKYAVSFNNLCRKYREPDLYCINKKNGIPTLFHKKTTGDIVSRGQKYFAHTPTHTNENNEKLVLICPPSL